MTTTHRIAPGDDLRPWQILRHQLWPEVPLAEHTAETAGMCDRPDRFAAFLATDRQGAAVGFAEAAIRHDYVNGCDTETVGFLEGIYVDPAHRRTGIARLLCAAAEHWAATQGCTEFASDAEIDNIDSQHMHAALGFAETERIVFFRKPLPPTA